MNIRLSFSIILALIVSSHFVSKGQTIPAVPASIRMFGLHIILEEKARQNIEKDMAYLASKRQYVDAKLAKMAIYFPVIENIFEQNGIPKEFKYLCAQESSFIADAVSTSNAVGFWQFKASTATDHGLRVDEVVDERKNIVAATWAAASYLKNNNRVLQNWVSTLLSYRLGLTGAKGQIPAHWQNASEITIDHKVDWYVLRNIAHFIFFENELEQYRANTNYLYLYPNAGGKSFDDIATELQIAPEELKKENTWCQCQQIPQDKNYVVVSTVRSSKNLPKAPDQGYSPITAATSTGFFDIELGYPVLVKNEKKSKKTGAMFYTINGKEGILATKGDSPESLAKRADLKVNYLMAYNDLEPSASISPNMVYYLERKNRRSKNAEYHTVKKGQSMWLISQMYAIRKNKLQRLNRMKKNEALQEGRIMHLSKRLKRKDAIQYKRLPFGNEQLPTEKAPILVENPTATLPAVASNVPTSTSTSEPAKPSIDENTVYVNTGERKVLVREKKPYDAPTEVVKSEANSMEKPSKNPDGIHIVQAGETMFGIAKKYNILLSDLKAWNQKAGFEVTIGEYLKIVAPQLRMTTDSNTVYAKASSPKTTATIHTVQAGETLYRVSVNYGVPVEKIKADNSLTSNTIAVGQRLKISK